MVPTYLSVRNFLSYGEDVPPLDFGLFHVACLTGNNGHGKSALLDAITYALWGEARKRSGDRKPDEGLLRLGASEMRVEFGFSLSDCLYRAIRSFRKGRRTSSTQLDLQVLDSEAGVYRPLSEGASLTQTQVRINQLLSMDYETFINSAFILQGRSNEFTQRSSRQRKEVLAEILNLNRYEQLRGRAHMRLQETTQRARQQDQQLMALREKLAGAEEYRGELKETADLLETRTLLVETQERGVAELADRLNERNQLRNQRSTHLDKRDKTLTRKGEITRESASLMGEMAADEDILRSGARLEEEYAEFLSLTAGDARMQSELGRSRELRLAHQELEAAITGSRHQLEKEREKWDAQAVSLGQQRENLRSLLDRETLIVANYRLLDQTRASLGELNEARDQKLELSRERDRCDLQIQMEKKRLEGEGHSLRSRLVDLETKRADLCESAHRIGEPQSQVQAMEAKVSELDEVKSRGTQLNSDLEGCDRRALELKRAGDAVRERLDLLHGAHGPECPLCGNELDREHQQKIASELTRQEEEIATESERCHLDSEDLQEHRVRLRARFKELSSQVESINELRSMLARQQAMEMQLRDLDAECRNLAGQLEAVEQDLEEEEFAIDHRRLRQSLGRALESLNYDEEAHAAMEQEASDLASAEGEMALLSEARMRHERLTAESTEAETERTQIDREIELCSFAPEQQAELETVKRKLATIDYDEEEHCRIRSRLESLGVVTERRERLLLARQRQRTGRELRSRYDRELATLDNELEHASKRLDTIDCRLEALGDLDREHRHRSDELADSRRERDDLLQRQGSLKAQIERCDEWQSEAETIVADLAALRDRTWILEELTEAFGKDGIQALIIENAIPEIEEEANAILARLTDSRIQISIESLRDLKKGGTRETLDIKIADEIGERSYHLYSGGEAFRTDFALRIALAKTLARRAGTRLRTLIVDEGFGTQDSDGIDYLIDAINEISRDFDKLIVVTHLPELKNAFPVQIQVTKHPDIGSRFEIIDNN